jgi:hypothetical protein
MLHPFYAPAARSACKNIWINSLRTAQRNVLTKLHYRSTALRRRQRRRNGKCEHSANDQKSHVSLLEQIGAYRTLKDPGSTRTPPRRFCPIAISLRRRARGLSPNTSLSDSSPDLWAHLQHDPARAEARRTLNSSMSQVVAPNGVTAAKYIAGCAAESVSARRLGAMGNLQDIHGDRARLRRHVGNTHFRLRY